MVQRAFPPDAGPVMLLRRAPTAALASATVAFTTSDRLPALRSRPGIIVLITAIGVSILLQNIMAIVTHASPYFWHPSSWARTRRRAHLIEPFLTYADAFAIEAVRAHGVAAVCRLRDKMGMAMRAVSQNKDVAALMGIK